MKITIFLFFILITFEGCNQIEHHKILTDNNPYLQSNKPSTRYWWFADEIKKEDVKFNLDWLKDNGFGGVEIAWVYPLNRMQKDTTYTARFEWLSKEFKEIVNYTKQYADSIGMCCDFTFGTLWPFGDSYVKANEATRKWGDSLWRQEITASWEYPKKGLVVDHLNSKSFDIYAKRINQIIPYDQTFKFKSALFVDSWEVETRFLWTPDFDIDFMRQYNYDIKIYMDSIYSNKYADYRYDYMKLISQKTIRFYKDFTNNAHAIGYYSRGQCSGAPCDIISAYAQLDIPEGEAMLYEPEFSNIVASAATLSCKPVVTSETFTCLYGWPRDHIGEEQTADLKMLADALFANGINHIIWHGKAHNPKNVDTVQFYASVHLGSNGALANELKPFNAYLENISSFMKAGKNYSDIAVYIPTEDAWMEGDMPKDKQFIWAWGAYEMRYVYFPKELKGYRPLWINQEFLTKSKLSDNKLIIGDASFSMLYIDVEYLDYDALSKINEFAQQGFPIVIKQTPKEPGHSKHQDYFGLLSNLYNFPNVQKTFDHKQHKPFIIGTNIPDYWVREDHGKCFVFFANPTSQQLKFPLQYGQSFQKENIYRHLEIQYLEKSYKLELEFKPYQSILIEINSNGITYHDIEFIPKTPLVVDRPKIERERWEVE